jgi:membrane-bound lytic murein transglycosylase B
MQFMPATFDAYGVDGDRNGLIEVDDLEDAVFGAANHLCANGAGDPSRVSTAVFN